MYKEPFLLPMENLPVGLGDIRKLSVSNGLEERAEGQGVTHTWEDPGAQTRPGGLLGGIEAWRGPGLGSQAQHRDSRCTCSTPLRTSQTPITLRALSQTAHVNGTPFGGPPEKLSRGTVDTRSVLLFSGSATSPSLLSSSVQGAPLSLKGPLWVLVTGKAGNPKGTCEIQGKWVGLSRALPEPALGTRRSRNLPTTRRPALSPSLKGLALAPWGPDAAGASWEAFPACRGQLQAAGCLPPWVCVPPVEVPMGSKGPPGEEVSPAPTRQVKTLRLGVLTCPNSPEWGESSSRDPRLGCPPQEEEIGETGPKSQSKHLPGGSVPQPSAPAAPAVQSEEKRILSKR